MSTVSYEESVTKHRHDTAMMLEWARCVIVSRPPDVLLRQPDTNEPYLERWFVVPRNDVSNVYLHRFLSGDPDRDPHDHRGDNVSWILEGMCYEVSPGVSKRMLVPGDRLARVSYQAHKIELIEGPVISLFTIGPITRDWGFHTPEGWVQWEEYHRRRIASKLAEPSS